MRSLKEMAVDAFERIMARAAADIRKRQAKQRYIPIGPYRTIDAKNGKLICGGQLGQPVRVQDRRIVESLERDSKRKPYSYEREKARRLRQMARAAAR